MGKIDYLKKLSTKENIIAALAIDQRGALRRMMGDITDPAEQAEKIRGFKKLVAEVLSPHASAILLDPEYGRQAIEFKDDNCGLILAYEITGYDTSNNTRYPDLILDESVLRLQEKGADAVKILLYYDVDQEDAVNDRKKAFIERVGLECKALDIPFFLEILTYDHNMKSEKTKEYAKIKPYKVIEALKAFTDPRYFVDVFKVEVPVNMNYVEGFGEEVLYTQEEAKAYFKQQSDLANKPFIFLSAGVTNQMFVDTLYFAKEAGSKFNGVLCGRATWAGGVEEFASSPELGKAWMENTGVPNINKLNEALLATATPWA